MAHPHEDFVRAGFEAFAKGDFEALKNQFFTEDVVWHVPGRNLLGGEHTGLEQVRDYLSKAHELSDGTVSIELKDVVANDRHAVALFQSRAERKGRKLDTFDAIVLRLEGGRVAEAWHRSGDQYIADVFWS